MTRALRIRSSVRALILDEQNRVLLCRIDVASTGVTVWVPPGGGVEPGESHEDALRRELDEEVGSALSFPAPHLWTQRVVFDEHVPGYDGVVNDCYLVRAANFEPAGSLGQGGLLAEGICGFRWWAVDEMGAYEGTGGSWRDARGFACHMTTYHECRQVGYDLAPKIYVTGPVLSSVKA